MGTYYIGNTSQIWDSANGTGWNTSGVVWGNSAADTFVFENNAFAQEIAGNNAWKIYGNGGADTVDFGVAASGVTFNLAQLQTTSGSYTVVGSGFNDTFQWNGVQSLSINGNGGANDTLIANYATAGITLNANSSSYTNIEHFIGSSYNDSFTWNGGTATVDGGVGNDTLTLGASASLDLNGTNAQNFEKYIGSAYNDTFSWNGSGILNLAGGGGTDTLLANTSAGSATFNFAESTIDTTYIKTVAHNGSTGNATYIFSSLPTLTIQGAVGLNDFVLFNTTTGLSININDSKFGSSIDSITGGSGNDTFTWDGVGSPTLNGGAGNNALSASSAAVAVTFDLNNTSTVTGFTNFTGSSLDDTFMWNGTGSSIFTLAGGSGTDSLKLYGGEATAYTLANLSMTSIEAIIGTSANDNVLWNGSGSYSFDLGGGSQDTLNVGTATSGKDIDLSTTTYKNIEILNGSSLNDTLRGGSLAESLAGGNGADLLYGGADTANDTLYGGNGTDTYYWQRGYGNDKIQADSGDNANDVVQLTGVSLADLNIGSTVAGSLNAITRAASSADIVFDFIKDGVESNLTMTLNNDSIGTKIILSDATFNLFVSNGFTNLTGTSIADLIYGNTSGGNSLNGGLGADTLIGGTGNDTFVYGSTDVYFGKAGNDVIDASASTTATDIDLTGSAFSQIEFVTGSSLADVIRGASTADSLSGGNGADILWGRGGNDTLTGGAGADTYWFYHDEGKDTITSDSGNSASDVVKLSGINFADLSFSVATSTGNDAVLSFVGTTGYSGSLTLLDYADQNGSAATASTKRVNTFITDDLTFGLALGTSATTTLYGTSIADYVLANGGVDDTIDGGAGADSIYGGAANDYIKYYSADAIVSGGAGTDTLAATSAGTLDIRNTSVFSGIEFLLGSSGDDVLRGATGNETLSGGVGADHLWGYSGADSMNGGVGSDTYWFTTGDGSDTIADDSLNASTDAVILNNLTFSSLTFGVLTNDNLVIDIGTGADSLTLQSWLTHTNTYRVNKFVTSDKTFGLAVANDTATNLTGTSYDDYMKGGAGNDTLTAGVGADSLYGGGGNDVLKYNATGAIYDGQTGGADTLTAASMTSAVDISLYKQPVRQHRVPPGFVFE